jgi:hypothetical protein
MTVEDQLEHFELCVEAFAGSVAALDERVFLRKVANWTVRDIVAHLVGWNRHILRGAKQILRCELPFYEVEPGSDYSNVNAALIREYGDTDRSALLESLAASAGELTAFLRAIDPGDWDRDFGVRYKGETETVKSTVDDLIGDYDHHRVQLEKLRASAV